VATMVFFHFPHRAKPPLQRTLSKAGTFLASTWMTPSFMTCVQADKHHMDRAKEGCIHSTNCQNQVRHVATIVNGAMQQNGKPQTHTHQRRGAVGTKS